MGHPAAKMTVLNIQISSLRAATPRATWAYLLTTHCAITALASCDPYPPSPRPLASFSQVTPPNRVRLCGLPAHPNLEGRLPPQAKLGGQVTPPGQTVGSGYPPHSKPAAQVTRRCPNPGYHQVQVTPPPGLGSQVTPPTARRGRGAARRWARLVPRIGSCAVLLLPKMRSLVGRFPRPTQSFERARRGDRGLNSGQSEPFTAATSTHPTTRY